MVSSIHEILNRETRHDAVHGARKELDSELNGRVRRNKMGQGGHLIQIRLQIT